MMKDFIKTETDLTTDYTDSTDEEDLYGQRWWIGRSAGRC